MAGHTIAVEARGSSPLAHSDRNYRTRRILGTIGWRKTCFIVWHATPWPWRVLAFPYGLIVYRRLFAVSDTLRYLRAMHTAQYDSSWLFRLVRPRYRMVEHLLRRFGLTDEPR